MKIGLKEFIKSNRLYLDGAMGSELISRGFNAENALELNLTHPEAIEEIHREYLKNGAKMIYANTFSANSLRSKCDIKAAVNAAVASARRAANEFDAYVAYDAGPLGALLEPFTRLTVAEAYQIFKNQADIIRDLPLDAVVIETVTDTLEMKTAILAFKENTDFPIFASMSFADGGRTFTGASVESFALIAEGLGVDAIGINCSLGADTMLPLVKSLRAAVSVPIFIKPNAGLPIYRDGKTFYDQTAEEFSSYMREIAKEGVSILGGCCGTTPEYIRMTAEKTADLPVKHTYNKVDALAGGGNIFKIRTPVIIGERVNPTGKPLLKKAIIDGDYNYITSLCIEQCSDGADVLDINAGIGGIDEVKTLSEIVKRVQYSAPAPLQIDSGSGSAIEAALRVLNGTGIVNSVNGKEESLNEILPLVKKYGAYVVGLTLDENGIPDSAEGRLEIARRIVQRAEKLGIDRSKVIIDTLTMAVGVDKNNPKVTLDALRLVKKTLGVRTILGLSNVSFGLPERDVINAEFFRQALEAGLDFAIVNPALKPKYDKDANKLLSGLDENCQNYIATRKGVEAPPQKTKDISVSDCILRGLTAYAENAAVAAAANENYQAVIDKDIIGALNTLGQRYESGEAFLPDLIAGAESAKIMLAYIKEKFIADNSESGEVMLLATVKGDIHDIGKNIVKSVLSNYGYRIIDLGKDVPKEEIIDAVIKYSPKYVGLSALMTTTLPAMQESVAAIKAYDSGIVVLIGGAVVTEEYRAAIGADIYAKDPQDAVNKLKRIK